MAIVLEQCSRSDSTSKFLPSTEILDAIPVNSIAFRATTFLGFLNEFLSHQMPAWDGENVIGMATPGARIQFMIRNLTFINSRTRFVSQNG
jgi:hypothetical protein